MGIPMNNKVRSVHFIFDDSVTYRDLTEVYPELFRKFLEASMQMPEDENLLEIWIERDVKELKKGKKPEGFLKQNAIKMVFPITDGPVQFYIYTKIKTEQILEIASVLEKVLKKAKLKHSVEYDRMLRFANSK